MLWVLSFRVIISLATIDVVLVIGYIALGGYAGNNKYDIIVYFMIGLSAITFVLAAMRGYHEYSEYKAIKARHAQQIAVAIDDIIAGNVAGNVAVNVASAQEREGYINGRPAQEIIEIEGAPRCEK